MEVIRKIEKLEERKGFRVRADETLYYEDRKVIQADQELRDRVLREAHNTPYAAHPSTTKMYQDLKLQF